MVFKKVTIALLLSLGVLYFCSINCISLTDPDEAFYSLTAKEMSQAQSFVTPLIFGHPQFEKPPMFYWALMGSFEMFGFNPGAARLVPALCGLLGLLMTFFFCRRVFGEDVAYTAVMILGTCALYLVMSKAVLTDIMLAVFMAGAFYAFYLWMLEGKQFWLDAFAVLAGLAVLTKGPVAIIILLAVIVIYLCWLKEFKLLKEFAFNRWALIFCAVAVPWYAVMIYKHGRAFIDEFIIHDNWDRILSAEHKRLDTWHFYPMVMTAGLFPWTFYLILMGRRWKEFSRECLFLLIWIAVTFIIFQRAHSKLASYILPLVPALAIVLSISVSSIKEKCRRINVLAFVYGLLGVALIIAPMIAEKRFPQYIWPLAVWGIRLLGLSFIGAAFYLWRGKILNAMLAKMFGILLLFLIAGAQIPKIIDRTAADQYLGEIIRQEGYEGLPVVTNKIYARGVHLYTGNPVVVIDSNKQPFWSSHPVDVISSHAEVMSYFENNKRVLCVVKKIYKEGFDQMFKGKRINRVINQDGAKVTVMSERLEETK